MNWRDQKREARRIVHSTMGVVGHYYVRKDADPIDIVVRVHTKFQVIGDDRSMGWPEIQEVRPRLVFMRDELLGREIDLTRNGVVYIQPGEAYRLDNVLPPDDITVTAEATRLTKGQMVQENLPSGDSP